MTLIGIEAVFPIGNRHSGGMNTILNFQLLTSNSYLLTSNSCKALRLTKIVEINVNLSRINLS